MANASDIQIGGSHYKDLEIEPWDVMEKWFTQEEFVGFLKGCALKRIGRCGRKDEPIVEMKKAHHELGKAIEIMEMGLNYYVKELKVEDLEEFLEENGVRTGD